MALTFLQLQNAVISDRFNETQRSDVKNWINHRYGWLWSAEDWTFKQAVGAVTVTAGSTTVTGLPTDLEAVKGLFNNDGDELTYLGPLQFNREYYADTATGTPGEYTIVNGAITVGVIPSATSSAYRLVYTKAPTMLSADGDTPTLPAAFHFLLVDGAAALGLKLQNDPTWQAFDQEFQAGIEAMRRTYLSDHKGPGVQWGNDPLGSY